VKFGPTEEFAGIVCDGSGPVAHPQDTPHLLDDACDGLRASTCGDGVYFAAMGNSWWDPDYDYKCPEGFTWMTSEQYRTKTDASTTCITGPQEGMSYHDQCGWNGYYHGGVERSYFRFADSTRDNPVALHAGNPDRQNIVKFGPTEEFAGIVCDGSATGLIFSQVYKGRHQQFYNRCDTPGNLVLSSLPSTTSYTIEARVKPDSYGSLGIVGWGNYGTTNRVNALRLSGDGIVNDWGSNDLSITVPDLADGDFHDVTATWDSDSGVREIFVDGVSVSSETVSGYNAEPINFCVGKTDANEYFSGRIKYVKIYNRRIVPSATQTAVGAESQTRAFTFMEKVPDYYKIGEVFALTLLMGTCSLAFCRQMRNPLPYKQISFEEEEI